MSATAAAARRLRCDMRIQAVLVVVALGAALAAHTAAAQPAPANSGCGDGATMSATPPTVRLTSPTLRLRSTGRVRIHLRGNQTAAATVTIAQLGGRRVGGTSPGTYTCVTAEDGIVALELNAFGASSCGATAASR